MRKEEYHTTARGYAEVNDASDVFRLAGAQGGRSGCIITTTNETTTQMATTKLLYGTLEEKGYPICFRANDRIIVSIRDI